MKDQAAFDRLKTMAEAEMEAEVMSTKRCECKGKGITVVQSTTNRPYFRHGFAVCFRCNGLIYGRP